MLTSLQNPLVKQIRRLHRAKGRREAGQFLLEGTHLLQEACAVGQPLDVVCCTEGWCDREPELWGRLGAIAARLELVSPEVLAAMATTVTPDGVIALAPRDPVRFGLGDAETDPAEPAALEPFRVGLLLETVQDPGNLGTIIRAAAATGVDRLWVSADSVDLDHPKVLRATAGQWFRVPCGVCSDSLALVDQAKAAGVTVLATTSLEVAGAMSYWEADLRGPVLLLLGNEGAGLSPALMAAADGRVSIPLASGVESLNVAIAAALLLYEGVRQRQTTQPD
ncbi:MAG: RNA methyltransferase [Cyanobacteria bacterium]|nr:RNA methyltransferase [Cyanobacteriota bacterium]